MKHLNTTIKPVIVALFISLLWGCGKDEKPRPNEPKTLLVKSITSTQTTTYHYDANNRATGFDVVFTNPVNNYSGTYAYNSSNQLSEVFYDNQDGRDDIKNVYFYNSSGEIAKIESYLVSDGSSIYESKTEADYTTPGKITVYDSPNVGVPYLNTVYTLDAKGNIIEQQSYSTDGALTATTENSDFDNKYAPSQSLPQTGYARNVNNYTKVTVTTPGGTPSINTYMYEYNDDGYPTKRTQNSGSIVTYEYSKK